MIIRSSHLALRFYKKDGWTLEKVESYCLSGSIETSPEDDDVHHMQYFRPAMDSMMANELLVHDHQIQHYDGEYLQSMDAFNYLNGF